MAARHRRLHRSSALDGAGTGQSGDLVEKVLDRTLETSGDGGQLDPVPIKLDDLGLGGSEPSLEDTRRLPYLLEPVLERAYPVEDLAQSPLDPTGGTRDRALDVIEAAEESDRRPQGARSASDISIRSGMRLYLALTPPSDSIRSLRTSSVTS